MIRSWLFKKWTTLKKLDHWIMQFNTFYWLSHYALRTNIPESTNKVSVRVSLKLKVR